MQTPRLSIDIGSTEQPLIEQSLGHFFDGMVERYPERPALVSCHEGIRWSYRELQQESNRLASALLESGLEVGDRLAIWSNNNAPWLLTQLATAKIGVILVNINPAYRVSELEYALNKVGCKALITMCDFKGSNYLGMINELAPELSQCAVGHLTAARLPALKTVIHLGEQEVTGMLRFADLMQRGSPSDARLTTIGASLKNDDAINIQFTSGTTGFPKGATLTHRNILNNGFFVGEAMHLTEHDRLCIPVPLYHCFGMVLGNLACLTHGACIVFPNASFDPLLVLEAVQNEQCTGLHGVPTMFIAELDHPRFAEFDLSTLRTGIMAGSPCPIEVMKRVVRDMHISEITIAPQGHTLPLGETGELCTLGYSVMKGYWGDPAKTAEAIDTEGWMHTGDLATMDDEGYVNIVGRMKDMVIRGGENVYPREIEEFLYRHPQIQDVQVIGVPDKKYGEELCALIIVRPGEQVTEQDIRTFCQGQIAHYKIPRYLRFVDTFPMTITGKVQKFKMREMMRELLNLEESKTA